VTAQCMFGAGQERADAGVRVAKGAPGYSLRLGSVVVLFVFSDDPVNCVLCCFLVGYIGLIVIIFFSKYQRIPWLSNFAI
jgi:hypothetical protein